MRKGLENIDTITLDIKEKLCSDKDSKAMTKLLSHLLLTDPQQQEKFNGCFSTSVALHVILRSFGYDPKLCYGLCVSPSGKGMYHAWLELDGKVLDLAIYGNSHFSPYWIDEPLGPVVFEDYSDTMMHYGNHEFDEDWNGSMISKAVEMGSIAKYITNAPHVNHPSGNGIWKMIFTILDETYTEDRQIDLQQFVSNDPI